METVESLIARYGFCDQQVQEVMVERDAIIAELTEALKLAKLGLEVAAEKAQEYEDDTWIADVFALDKINHVG